MSTPSLPVIVGVGHVTRHPADVTTATETANLLAAAAIEAAEDAGIGLHGLADIDSLDVLNLLSWKYADPAGAVASRIGATPAHLVYSEIGGEQPTKLIDAAAARVAAGEARLAMVVGGESLASRRVWAKTGEEPPWSERGEPPHPVDLYYGGRLGLFDAGLTDPTRVYPLFENAHRAATGTSRADAQAASARIWAGMAEVAARTPGAWSPQAPDAAAIASTANGNRPIAFPYLKLMCANPNVDQAAGVLVTTEDHARFLGIPEDKWVYPWAGAGARETEEVMQRPGYVGSAALEASLEAALDLVGMTPGELELRELYSCFPIVPKLALTALDLPDTAPATVAGGLTFYGGPLNAYMLCATVAMVARLRAGEGDAGLLYGNGGYLTKHHTLIVGRGQPPGGRHQPDQPESRQSRLDARPRPAVVEAPAVGTEAAVETWTVIYDRHGQPDYGVVLARTADGTGDRLVARVEDGTALLAGDGEPIGRVGRVTASGDGPNRFALA